MLPRYWRADTTPFLQSESGIGERPEGPGKAKLPGIAALIPGLAFRATAESAWHFRLLCPRRNITIKQVRPEAPMINVRAALVPIDGGSAIDIGKDMTLVGRKEDCDVRLDHKSVSKVHCVLVKTDGL